MMTVLMPAHERRRINLTLNKPRVLQRIRHLSK